MHLEEQKCNLRQTKSLWCVAMSWCTQNIVGALYCRHKYKHSKWKNELLSVTNTGQSASEPENSSQPVTGEVLEVAQSLCFVYTFTEHYHTDTTSISSIRKQHHITHITSFPALHYFSKYFIVTMRDHYWDRHSARRWSTVPSWRVGPHVRLWPFRWHLLTYWQTMFCELCRRTHWHPKSGQSPWPSTSRPNYSVLQPNLSSLRSRPASATWTTSMNQWRWLSSLMF